jgi:uncharacterized protein YpmS
MDKSSVVTAFSIAPTTPGNFAWEGNTSIYTPDAPLSKDTLYTVTISTDAKDMAGNKLTTQYTFKFKTTKTGDTTPPKVMTTEPENDAKDVPTTVTISITFSEPMDKPATNSAFTINPSAPGNYNWSATGEILNYDPTDFLQTSTKYTIVINTNACDLAGNKLQNEYTFSFTTAKITDITPPEIMSTYPVDGQPNVPPSIPGIVISFSEPMNKESVESNYNIVPALEKDPIHKWTATDDEFTIELINTPFETGLKENTKYTVVITADITDLAGNYMKEAYTFSFTTGVGTLPAVISTYPEDGAIDVSVNTKIIIRFSKPMDLATVKKAFSIEPSVKGTFTQSPDGCNVTFKPSVSLKKGTHYTVTISKDAKDKSGNRLAYKKVFSFRTEGKSEHPPPPPPSDETKPLLSTEMLFAILFVIAIVVIAVIAVIAIKRKKRPSYNNNQREKSTINVR